MDSSWQQIFRMGTLNDMAGSIIYQANRAARTFNTYVHSAVQMICNVLKYVGTFPCFTTDAISMVDWDIPAYHWLTSLKFGRTVIVWSVNNRQEFSEDICGIVVSIQQQVMKIQPFSQGF
jgi:hypothetical protein